MQQNELSVSQQKHKKGALGSGLKRFFKKVIKSNKKEGSSPVKKKERQRTSRMNSQMVGDQESRRSRSHLSHRSQSADHEESKEINFNNLVKEEGEPSST